MSRMNETYMSIIEMAIFGPQWVLAPTPEEFPIKEMNEIRDTIGENHLIIVRDLWA